MVARKTDALLDKLESLQIELIDLAFVLDSRGRCDAADVAITTSVRLGELCVEFRSAGMPGEPEDYESVLPTSHRHE